MNIDQSYSISFRFCFMLPIYTFCVPRTDEVTGKPLDSGHLQTTDMYLWSNSVLYMEVPLYYNIINHSKKCAIFVNSDKTKDYENYLIVLPDGHSSKDNDGRDHAKGTNLYRVFPL